MSYCVIGMKRTRSSVLTCSISNHFDSDNFFGTYDGLTPKLKDQTYFNRLPKIEQGQAKLQFLKDETIKLTDEVLASPNAVIKLFPRYMMYHLTPSVKNHANCVLPKDYNDIIMITDVEECYKLSKFKKLYLLKRNVTDAICSYGYGVYLNMFQFKDDTELNYFTKIANPTTISLDSQWLDFCIFESILLDHLQSYLDTSKLSYHLLDYDEIPDYCDQTYSKDKHYKYSNFDYKRLILNYNDIEEYISDYIEKNKDWVKNNIFFK